MKTLALIAVCACGLGMAGTARACDRSLGQQLASAGDQLMASVAASLHSAVSASSVHAGNADSGGSNGDVMDGVGSEASTAPPAGDLIGLPAKGAPGTKTGRTPPAGSGGGGSAVGSHDIGSRPPQALGWQSLLPGSIQ